jgi:hypothetical protein
MEILAVLRIYPHTYCMVHTVYTVTVWEYKNRVIVKKLFGTLPIFYSRLCCRLFVLIMFFDTRKGLICIVYGIFFTKRPP